MVGLVLLTMVATKEGLEAMAVRCENSIGPSRDIDRAIARLTGHSEVFQFTSSLTIARYIESSAMLLSASERGDGDGLPIVKLAVMMDERPFPEFVGRARTIELAWCAAALRARTTRL